MRSNRRSWYGVLVIALLIPLSIAAMPAALHGGAAATVPAPQAGPSRQGVLHPPGAELTPPALGIARSSQTPTPGTTTTTTPVPQTATPAAQTVTPVASRGATALPTQSPSATPGR